jgi:hypothetical protein
MKNAIATPDTLEIPFLYIYSQALKFLGGKNEEPRKQNHN